MTTEDRYIAALDFGSSRIALSLAQIDGGNINIIYYRDLPSTGVRNSAIVNETQVSKTVRALVAEAEETLGLKITQAVVGLPRTGISIRDITQSLDSVNEESPIEEKDIIDLKNFISETYASEEDSQLCVYNAVAQSYSNGDDINLSEEDIIGTAGNELTGNFKIFLGPRKPLVKIGKVMRMSDLVSAGEYFTPDTIGKAVLNADEADNGVAVIDLGGGCTSVSIFTGGILRHCASIPFGGKSITSDIKTECNISEAIAENIKLGYGACMPERLLNMTDKQLLLRSGTSEPDKRLGVKYLSEIITARAEEIMEAIIYEIDRSGLAKQIPSGVVITGGGAELVNLNLLITKMSGYSVRLGLPCNVIGEANCGGAFETDAANLIGLIRAAAGDGVANCAVTRSDFPEKQPETAAGAACGQTVAGDGEDRDRAGLQYGEDAPGRQGTLDGFEEEEDRAASKSGKQRKKPSGKPEKKPRERPEFLKKFGDGLLSLFEEVGEDDDNQ